MGYTVYLANGNLSKEHEIRGVLFSDHPRYQKKFYISIDSIYLFVYRSTFPSVPWIHMDPVAKGIVICGSLRALSWLLAWPSSTEVMDAMEAMEVPTNGGAMEATEAPTNGGAMEATGAPTNGGTMEATEAPTNGGGALLILHFAPHGSPVVFIGLQLGSTQQKW